MSNQDLAPQKRKTHDAFLMGAKTKRLIAKLKRWADEPGGYGRRVQIAKALNVTKQTVSNWFSGIQEPTGEQVLGIIEFLEKQQRK
jgi:transcriptional regulator with XRE-family HTH domain